MIASMTGLAAMMALSLAPQQYAPRGGDDGRQRVAPRGSYAQTCSGEYVNQGRLYADCRNTRGQLRGSSIELNACSAFDIANNDGLLVCGGTRGRWEGRENNGGGGWGGGDNGGGWGGGNNGGGWGGGNGGGRESVTVYRDARFNGESRTLRGEISNLQQYGFNDAISSMQMRGAWEVCTDANFRGNCQVIDGDARNLDRWGLNDRISSMRPARRGGGW